MIFKEFYTTQEFAELAKIVPKTVRRLKDKILKQNPITGKIKHSKKPYKFHHSLLKEFLSPNIYSLILENKSLRNTIKCLRETDSLGYKLFQLDWTWWCTVAYKYEFTSDQCRMQMDEFYKHVEEKFGSETGLRMYYTTESFDNRQGNHNHFVFNVTNPKMRYTLKNELEDFLGKNRLDVKKYDAELPCIFYSGKEGLQGTAWDIWGNNLKEDGVKYANQGNRKTI